MDQPTVAPEPGWYPDAADPTVERWWDGSAWSPVTRPSPTVPGSGSGDGGAVPPPVWSAPPGPASPPGGAGDGSPWGSPPQPGPSGPSGNPYAPPSDRPGGNPYPGSNPYRPPSPGQGGPGLDPSRPPVPRSPGDSGPVTPDGVPLAAPALRWLARVIDLVVAGALGAVAGIAFLAQTFDALRPQLEALTRATTQDAQTAAADSLVNAFYQDPAVLGPFLRYQFVALLVGGVYSTVMVRLWGGTVGKLLVGIRVRTWESPDRPTWTQAMTRWLTREAVAKISFAGIGATYWLLDSGWLLWDPRRQCLHDKLPGTVVVRHRHLVVLPRTYS